MDSAQTASTARPAGSDAAPAWTPVLIVGAGPTGLMLACQLAKLGVAAVIVDAKAGTTQESRALVVHARSLELYDALGIGPAALAAGRRVDGLRLFVRGRPVERLPFAASGEDDTGHPYLLVLEQSRNEALLLAQLERSGGEVRWQTEVETIVQDRDGVDVTARGADGALVRWRADWVVGCDGARSIVRRACRLGFAGGTYRNHFYVVDARVDGDLPPGEVVPSLSSDAFALFIPMPGERRYRVVGPFPTASNGHRDDLEPADHDDDDEPSALATSGPDGGPLPFGAIESVIRERMDVDVRFSDVSWFSAYRVHHRCVERFRSGRCFVAGDSAHVHSPVGAQGMNTGLQDAANLGWKLALVARGRASPGLLDSYHAERWPVAQSLLRTTDSAFQFVISRAAPVRAFRLQVLPRLAASLLERPGLRRALFRRLSQIGIGYRQSPLVDAADAASVDRLRDAIPEFLGGPVVRAGDRLPFAAIGRPWADEPTSVYRWLDSPGFHVLLMDRHGDPAVLVPECHAALEALDVGPARVRALRADPGSEALFEVLGVQDEALVVVRPDHHIGLFLSQIDLPHMADWFRRALRPSDA